MEKSIARLTGSIPVVFKGIERQFAKDDSTFSSNSHDFHELNYIKSGKAVFEIEGRKLFVGRKDTLIIRPGKAHIIQAESKNVDMVVLYFGFKPIGLLGNEKVAPIESFLQFASGDELENNENFSSSPYLIIKGRAKHEISQVADRIVEEMKGSNHAKELMMQFLTMELLISLARGLRDEWEESLRVRTGKAQELVMIAKEYILQNYYRDISVSDIASHVFLSQGYFTRAFKDIIGMSPINFLIKVRLEKACKILRDEDIKVSGIARSVGFASPQRFNAAFRKYMGVAPLEYRKNRALENNK